MTVGLILYILNNRPPTIGTVDSARLFNEFRMTKEMQALAAKENTKKVYSIDSLKYLLTMQGIDERKTTINEIYRIQDSIEVYNNRLVSQESKKISARIKSYTAEYAAKKNYDFIIGTSDYEHNLLFAARNTDVTRELLNFINMKYEGLQ